MNPTDCGCPCPTPETVNTPGLTGQSAFTLTAATFVVPAVSGSVTIEVDNTDWIAVGEPIFIEGAGTFTVTAVVDGTHVTITYLDIPANTASGNTIAVDTLVTPSGTSSDGEDGENAFTVTTDDFTVPAISGTATDVEVGSSAWMTIGQVIFVQNAGYFEVTAKSDNLHWTGTYLNVPDNTNAGANCPAGSQVSPAGPTFANPVTVALGGTNATTASAARANLGVGGASLTVYAAGTAYQLTSTPAALVFGTTSPSLTINAVGTWLLLGRVRVDYNGATFAAVRTGTLKWRRTNNTAADLTNGSGSFLTDIITTLSYTLEVFNLPPVVYVTTNTNDVITIFGDISVVPSAGSLDCVQAEIIAIKLLDQTL